MSVPVSVYVKQCMTFTPLTEAVEALALDPAMIIMQFVQQLAAAIYLGNKKANRVLNIDKTSVAMRNQKLLATLDEEGKLRWCVEHEDKMQNNKDPTNTSKVDHYFSALLAIIKIKWGLALSIKGGNQVSFEDLVTCYATHTNYPSLTKSNEAIFNLATTQYKEEKNIAQYKEEKNIVMKFHVLKFHSEAFDLFPKVTQNPILDFFF
jgi:Mg2+/citrate symporter